MTFGGDFPDRLLKWILHNLLKECWVYFLEADIFQRKYFHKSIYLADARNVAKSICDDFELSEADFVHLFKPHML